jgi:3-hydroxyacyl-[acyl-carrier-protein] dehydratase
MDNPYRLDVNQIQKFLPHRAPFLLVDRILEIHSVGYADIGTRVVGLKNVTFNEPHFQGHFPKFAIMPGVLLIETLAQVASFSVYPNIVHDLDRFASYFQCILVGVDRARFRKPVVPGDCLKVESEVVKCRGKIWAFQCSASVDGQKVVEAELLANLVTTAPSESTLAEPIPTQPAMKESK